MTTLHLRKSSGPATAGRAFLLIPLVLTCFALSPAARAVVPAPDGGYPGANTAEGTNALFSRTTGVWNTALGGQALFNDTNGDTNTAVGLNALYFNTTGSQNVAIGVQALLNNTGGSNIALGVLAGTNLTTGGNNIDIGNRGVAAESNTIRIGAPQSRAGTRTFIAGIYGATAASGVAVYVNSSGQLGTSPSSARFKQNIQTMGDASGVLLALRPVTFNYKAEIDPEGIPQFGLVAEEVEKVNPALVAHDADGKVYTVRYEAVNAMLLNEFLKEHRKVEEQQATITQVKSTVAKQEATIAQQQKDFQATAAQQQKEIKALTGSLKEQASQIQKVSDQLELSKPAPRTVVNNR